MKIQITTNQSHACFMKTTIIRIITSGPHVVPCYPGLEQLSKGPFYSWRGDDDDDDDGDACWDKSMVHLADYLRINGPFDGVYGFSQGCAIITHFLQNHPGNIDSKNSNKFPWKFCILVAKT